MAVTYLKLWIIFSFAVGTFSTTDIFNDFHAKTDDTAEASSLCSKAVLILGSDGGVTPVDEKTSCESVTLRDVIAEYPLVEIITLLPNITSHTIAKVMEYYHKYHETRITEDGKSEFKRWESEFLQVDPDTLINLIQATEQLQLKQLLDLSIEALEKMFLGKSDEEIREMYCLTSAGRKECRSVEEHKLASE